MKSNGRIYLSCPDSYTWNTLLSWICTLVQSLTGALQEVRILGIIWSIATWVSLPHVLQQKAKQRSTYSGQTTWVASAMGAVTEYSKVGTTPSSEGNWISAWSYKQILLTKIWNKPILSSSRPICVKHAVCLITSDGLQKQPMAAKAQSSTAGWNLCKWGEQCLW